ncbi:MAG: TIGR04282 family arsenosugar biosynthesis glycosyltransferase [Pseudomonadota bacterium]
MNGAPRAIARNLCLFVRPALQGQVKTRLAREIGAPAALAAYAALVDHAVNHLQVAPDVARCLWVAGDPADASVIPWRNRWRATVQPQQGTSLGERMRHTFLQHARADARGDGATIIVGSDCPTVDAVLVRQAFAALEDADVALAPAEDGGFGLIGVRHRATASMDALLDRIDWGTAQVYEQTVAALARRGCQPARLAQVWDVDTHADWLRFLETFPRAEATANAASGCREGRSTH